MKKLILIAIVFFFVSLIITSYAEDIIVYTAHQNFDSRIYLLQMNGSVITFHEYSFYFFADVEVVNNEVYVAEAFAPRAYKVDLTTGNLDLVIDDWSLFYFYDLTFDGTYFYVTEWDLNRYDINGNKNGTASFDEDVMGGAWDGTYYWTLNDMNEIKCWDISTWPTITEVSANNFTPPTPDCRGLWFDRQYFWTSESIESTLGHIYKFDYTGTVIDQWLEPTFRGWGACVVDYTGINKVSKISLERRGLRFECIHPNPFRSHTTVTYILPKPDRIQLTIYNALGQRVSKLVDGFEQAGRKSLFWSGTDDKGDRVVPGIYIIKLVSSRDIEVRKIVLVE